MHKIFCLFRFFILFTILLAGCKSYLSYNSYINYEDSYGPKTPLLSEVLMYLQLDYLNQEKLDPQSLLIGALSELERNIPEVWVYPKFNLHGNKQSLKIVIGRETTIIPNLKLEGLIELKIILQRLLKNLLEKNINFSKLEIEQIFVEGILNRLDGYSVLLPREIYRDFNINIDGYFAGVGLVVGMREGFLTVITPMDGSPAARAGIQPFDRILTVDEEKIEHLTLEEILQRLRGKLGTTVKLSVFRKGNINTLNFVLEREEIKVESVEKFDLFFSEKKIRYIRIKNFQIGTSEEILKKINDISGIDGLILDLRNNPGGLLDEAVKISDLFLPGKNKIVSTKGPSVSKIHESKSLFLGELFEKIPLAVLINRGSASASEIIAASLKQHDRAILIGERSFGKGTVQTLWDLEDGSGLKLSVGEYLTPLGTSIHNIGVEPSVYLMPVYISEGLKDIQKSYLEKKSYPVNFKFRLIGENKLFKRAKGKNFYKIRYLKNNEKVYKDSEIMDEKIFLEKLKSDIFVKVATLALDYPQKEKINLNLKAKFDRLEKKENKKIFQKLSKFGIDWNKNELRKNQSLNDLDFEWEAQQISDDILNINIKIFNIGNDEINRIIAVTRSSNVLLDGLEFPIGRILPGESTSRNFDIKFSIAMMDEIEPFEIILYDQNHNILDSVRKKLKFYPKRNTLIKLTTKIFDNGKFGSFGNGDGKIQTGETIALKLDLMNMGKEIIPELLIKINGSDGKFRINRGKTYIKNLLPNLSQNEFFLFKVLPNTENLGKLKFEMLDTKSGMPRIVKKWNLNQDFYEKQEFIPKINSINLYDNEDNLIEGETNSGSASLRIKVQNTSDFKDIFVHLNNFKVFYSAIEKNVISLRKKTLDEIDFSFISEIKLKKGKNIISVFARNLHGTTTERKIKINFRNLNE